MEQINPFEIFTTDYPALPFKKCLLLKIYLVIKEKGIWCFLEENILLADQISICHVRML